jgi:hypothetical protein
MSLAVEGALGMRGRVAVAGAADLAVDHPLGQLGIAVLLDAGLLAETVPQMP